MEFQVLIAFSSFVVHVLVANAMVMKKEEDDDDEVMFFTLPTFC